MPMIPEANKMECNTDYEGMFSVELKSKVHLKRVNMTNETQENTVVEGSIGKLLEISFIEGIVLEVIGDKGILRLDLGEAELKECIQSHCRKNKSQRR
jgi:hypothetical protein